MWEGEQVVSHAELCMCDCRPEAASGLNRSSYSTRLPFYCEHQLSWRFIDFTAKRTNIHSDYNIMSLIVYMFYTLSKDPNKLVFNVLCSFLVSTLPRLTLGLAKFLVRTFCSNWTLVILNERQLNKPGFALMHCSSYF